MVDIAKISMERIDNLDVTIADINADITSVETTILQNISTQIASINAKITSIETTISSMKYVTEVGENDNGCYRKWSDGFIEQYGSFSFTIKTTDTKFSHTYPIPFTDGNYSLQISIKGGWSTSRTFGTEGQGLTKFDGYAKQSTQTTVYLNWYACGY